MFFKGLERERDILRVHTSVDITCVAIHLWDLLPVILKIPPLFQGASNLQMRWEKERARVGGGGCKLMVQFPKGLVLHKGSSIQDRQSSVSFQMKPWFKCPNPYFQLYWCAVKALNMCFLSIISPFSIYLSFLPPSHSFRALEPFCSFHKIWYSQNNVNEKWLIHNPARATLQSPDMKTNTLC